MDFVQDALAGVAYLKSRPDIDHRHIGLIGHSEGGLIAPLCAVRADARVQRASAERSPGVSFVVLMAGPGLPGSWILERQSQLIQNAAGIPTAVIQNNLKVMEGAIQIVIAEPGAIARRKRLTQYIEAQVRTPASQAQLSVANNGKPMSSTQQDAFVKQQVEALASPWMRLFVMYDPRPTLGKVDVPLLAIDGSKDLQVPPAEDLAAIAAAARIGNNRNVTTLELPGLNHLFQPATTGSPAEYEQIETTLDPSALRIIGDWIVGHVGK